MPPQSRFALELYRWGNRYPFREWYDGLSDQAANQVSNALDQLEAGNWNNVRALGDGVSEYRLGAGYRVYFGRDGNTLWLLHGGDKNNRREQQRDIARAKRYWRDYQQG